MLQKVIVKVSQQDGVGHCFDKNSLKSTEKCQILKKKKRQILRVCLLDRLPYQGCLYLIHHYCIFT